MHCDTTDVRHRIKRIVSNVTRIPVERIGDEADFRQDLGLDSLSMLEIGVDVDYEFKLGVDDLEQRLGGMPTVAHVVSFVAEHLEQRRLSA